MRNSSGPESAAAPATAATVYLAETTSDLTEQRDSIKRELTQRGYQVAPDKSLPLVGSAFAREVQEYLSRSKLSIHLIGEHYGIVPEGESRSVIQLQNDLAAMREPELERIIWMPLGLEAKDDRQRKFVEELKLMLTGDLLAAPLKDLQAAIHEKLAQQNKPVATANGEAANVYLICDKQDMHSVRPLEDYLYDRGLDVTLPAMEGDESQIIQDHKDNLMMCDAAMIYYGQAGEIWMRMKQRELQKFAHGRAAPLAAKAIYISGPPTDSKERVRDRDALVIRNYDAFSPEPLQPFLELLQRAKGA
jgi:hypothetical protein